MDGLIINEPFNILTQATPLVGNQLSEQNKIDVINNIKTLRKLVITLVVVSDLDLKRAAEALKTSNKNLKDLLTKILSHIVS